MVESLIGSEASNNNNDDSSKRRRGRSQLRSQLSNTPLPIFETGLGPVNGWAGGLWAKTKLYYASPGP